MKQGLKNFFSVVDFAKAYRVTFVTVLFNPAQRGKLIKKGGGYWPSETLATAPLISVKGATSILQLASYYRQIIFLPGTDKSDA